MSWPTRRVRDLPLFWKLLLPFVVLLLSVGSVGTFLLVQTLARAAQATIDQELAQRSLSARAAILDRELYLLEAANLAANLEGMAEAVQGNDHAAVTRLLESVLALKTDLTLAAVVDRGGTALAQYARPAPRAAPTPEPVATWAGSPLADPVLASGGDATAAGLLGAADRPLAAIATSICAGLDPCTPVGAAVVAVDVADLVANASSGPASQGAPTTGVAVFDTGGRYVAGAGDAPRALADEAADGGTVRQRDEETATLFTPLHLQGRNIGTLAVSAPIAPAFASVRAAAIRLGLILLVAMAGIVLIGAAVSRFILAQVRHLLATNRALAQGDLSARTLVVADDELGQLARGVNDMAAALQDSHETLEAKVDARTADVRRLLEERTEFFTAVSHEFRTPLAVILGHADMLASADFAKDEHWQVRAGRILNDAASQLLSFVNDILEIARAEGGRTELDPADIRVDALLRDLRPTVESLADASALTANVHVPRTLPLVRADAVRLREIVLNLVDNAVKYTPPGGRVEVSAAAANGHVVLAVSDTGVGIPPDAADRIFDPFYRVRGTRPQNGQPSSGLGLALVQRLVQAQGGTVTFESVPGKGSTFRVLLPVAVPRDAREGAVAGLQQE